MRELTPRTIAVLEQIRAASKPKSKGVDRQGVAASMSLPRVVISSVFTRLEKNKLIERVLGSGSADTAANLNFKITKLGIEAIKRGSGLRADRLLQHRHAGAYSAAASGDWVAPRADRNVMKLPTYTPPKVTSARPDADEHLQHKSKGI